MIILGIKEKKEFEKRVSLTPGMVKRYKEMGLTVHVEKGAGVAAGFQDSLYAQNGAEIVSQDRYKDADIILCVNAPLENELKTIKKDAYLIGMLKPFDSKNMLKKYCENKIRAISMELLPRISRAQSMDVLSSQANLAGYRAVIEASFQFGRAFPLMMTAAGTVPAARVLILGVGVAGLQAIATARRLGAIVSAYDVRSETKEQVKSLGATFVDVESKETGDAQGGYAKEMSDDYKKAEAQKLIDVIKNQDIIITTAQIPGRQAPLLVTKEMIESMKPGSVIVDLAVESGGNCALSKMSEIVNHEGVKIVGPSNILSNIAYDASQLYAKNLYTFIKSMFKENEKTKTLTPEFDDELIIGTLLTKDGFVCHSRFKDVERKENDMTVNLTENAEKKEKPKAIKSKDTDKKPIVRKSVSKPAKTKKPQA